MLENKYTKWYFSLVNSRKVRVLSGDTYVEKHHIIPKSLGGSDDDFNIVTLTAREHYIAHLLLVKMVEGDKKSKMSFALRCMSNFQNDFHNRYTPPSKIYEIAKRMAIEATKAKNTGHPNYLEKQTREARDKISSSMKKALSNLTLEEMSERMKNSCCHPDSYTPDRSAKISKALFGRTRSDESKKKQANTRKELAKNMTEEERKKFFGGHNKGKPWSEARRAAHKKKEKQQ